MADREFAGIFVSSVISAGPSIEILGRGVISHEKTEKDISKVLAACTDWSGEQAIMRATGLGKGRVNRALALAGDRLERAAQARNTCSQRWIWRRV
jgi:hypothetical protein